MNLPIIQNVASLLEDRQQKNAIAYKRAERPDVRPDEEQEQGKKARQDLEQVQRRASILIKLSQDYEPFSRREAFEALNGLAGKIASESPWRLAKIQEVDRTLIPSAYV